MTDHSNSCNASSKLCDQLFELLARSIPKLRRSQSMRWCGLFQEGKKRFAYIEHRKTMQRIEVWCLGDPVELNEKSSIAVYSRKPTTSGFANFQARFFVDSPSDINDAFQILYEVSYLET